MCNCIQEMISKMENDGFENIEPPVDLVSGRLCLTFIGNKKGKKRKREIPVLLSRCPMCGKLYEEREAENNE